MSLMVTVTSMLGHGGTLATVKYRDDILASSVTLYAGAIGHELILMEDNARSQRARVVDEYRIKFGSE